MKLALRSIPLIIGSLVFTSAAHAVTSPMNIGDFNATRSQALTARMTSWNDPLFGEMGWTHHAAWGKFTAKAGQVVTIKAVSTSNPRFKPAVSVWYRGADDTAPDNYVPDHFFVQNANMYVRGAKDETTGASIGDISMKIVAFKFDKDSNKRGFLNAGVLDGIPGQLVFSFWARKTGTYMFALGGFSPAHSTLDPAVKYPVQTTVVVRTPVEKSN